MYRVCWLFVCVAFKSMLCEQSTYKWTHTSIDEYTDRHHIGRRNERETEREREREAHTHTRKRERERDALSLTHTHTNSHKHPLNGASHSSTSPHPTTSQLFKTYTRVCVCVALLATDWTDCFCLVHFVLLFLCIWQRVVCWLHRCLEDTCVVTATSIGAREFALPCSTSLFH